MKINGSNVNVEIIYKDNNGSELIAYRTLSNVLESNSEEILESCEAPCTSGSCFTESQNHYDCDGAYYDHEFHEIRIDTDQFKPKWNEFKEVGENDPEHGEIVVVCWPPEQMCEPEMITWGVDDYEVIHGCKWLSISKLLPLPAKP